MQLYYLFPSFEQRKQSVSERFAGGVLFKSALILDVDLSMGIAYTATINTLGQKELLKRISDIRRGQVIESLRSRSASTNPFAYQIAFLQRFPPNESWNWSKCPFNITRRGPSFDLVLSAAAFEIAIISRLSFIFYYVIVISCDNWCRQRAERCNIYLAN